MKTFRGPDGTPWRVVVQTPGTTNAMVVFVHPDANNTRLNRYAWYLSNGVDARSVTSRLSTRDVLELLSDRDLARLFRRAKPIDSGSPQFSPA